MSIDYVKCFGLIPQAVVLALALELGMDPGTCRALVYPCLGTPPPKLGVNHINTASNMLYIPRMVVLCGHNIKKPTLKS